MRCGKGTLPIQPRTRFLLSNAFGRMPSDFMRYWLDGLCAWSYCDTRELQEYTEADLIESMRIAKEILWR